MKFQSDAQRTSYDDFPQVTCLECNSGVCKNTNFLRSYLCKYSAKSSKSRTWVEGRCLLKWVFFRLLKRCRKNVIVKIPRWPVWSSETLESKALIRNVMKPAQEKNRKDRSAPYNSASSRVQPPLHYINEKFLDDSNDKTSFLYIGV